MNSGRTGLVLALAVLAPPAPAQDADADAVAAAAAKRQEKLLQALPKPQRDALANRPDRDAVLAGTTPLFAWRLHKDPVELPPKPIGGVAFADHGRELLTCGTDGTGKRFTIATGKEAGPLASGGVGAYSCAFAPRGRAYLTGGPDGTLRLWSNRGKAKAKIELSDDALYSVAVHPSGKLIGGCGLDGRAKVFDTKGRARFDFAGYGFGLRTCVFTPDGRALITSGRSEMVEWWDIQRDTPVRRMKVGPEQTADGEDFVTWSVAASPDSGRFAAAGSDGTVRVHAWNARKAKWANPAHPGGAYCVAWHPKAGLIASSGKGGEVRLWGAKDGRTIRTFKVDPVAVYGLAFSPKAPLLATVGSDSTARVWVLPELARK